LNKKVEKNVEKKVEKIMFCSRFEVRNT